MKFYSHEILKTTKNQVAKNRAELVKKIHGIIVINANFTTAMLAEELNIVSKNNIWRILNKDLLKRKVCARVVKHK